ncbi:MAG: hypothetical protein MR902_08535 [Campylobacter sp.]|nr:hypothetical protein [Campylobacter sp.]
MLLTILESVNISVNAFGLGRNLTKNESLSLEKYNLKKLNSELSKLNKMYIDKF